MVHLLDIALCTKILLQLRILNIKRSTCCQELRSRHLLLQILLSFPLPSSFFPHYSTYLSRQAILTNSISYLQTMQPLKRLTNSSTSYTPSPTPSHPRRLPLTYDGAASADTFEDRERTGPSAILRSGLGGFSRFAFLPRTRLLRELV